MGRKVALITAGIGGLVFLLTLTAFFLPLHTVAILALHKKLCRISISTVWVDIDAKVPQLWCNEMPNAPPEDIRNRRREVREGYSEARQWWCTQKWTEIRSLPEVRDQACSAAVHWLWPSFCEGMNAAYIAGTLLLIVMFSNAVVIQGVVAFVLHDYATKRPKKKLRQLATILVGVGALAMFVMVLGYAMCVSVTLDDARNGRLQSFAIPRFFLSTSEGFGFDWGFVVLMACICVQLSQLVCCRWIRTHEEDETELAKEREREKAVAGYGTMPDQESPQGGLGTSWYQTAPAAAPSYMVAAPPAYGQQGPVSW